MKKEELKEFLACTNAILDSMNAILHTEDTQNVWRFSNYYIYMRKYNELLEKSLKNLRLIRLLIIST